MLPSTTAEPYRGRIRLTLRGLTRVFPTLIRRHWQDAIAIAALLSAAMVIDRDLLTTGDYPRGEWGEWLGQAYRVRLIQQTGFLPTWDHGWTGGISLFQTYQFIPHVVTAIVASLADASIGRTMLVLEAFLILWVRCSGYALARMVGLQRVAALVAGVITFGIFNYSAEILTFTTLWGLAVTPLLLAGAWRYRDRAQIYLVAAVVGLSVYVHPHAFLAGVIALVAAFLVGRPTIERLGRLALQGAVIALATAFFYVPALLSAKPTMQDPESANVDFLRNIFNGNVDRVNDVLWVLVPIIAIVIVISWPAVRRPLLRYVVAFSSIALFLVALSYAGVGPESVRLMQSVRLLNLLPLVVGLLAAISVDAALRATPQVDRRGLVAPACVVLAAGVLFVPMFRFATDRSYAPAWYGNDVLQRWFEQHNYGQPGRVWMEGRETAWYTFKDAGRLRSARSAFVQGDWSLLARPLQEGLLVGDPDWQATEDYLKAMGVSYVLIADNTAAAPILQSGGVASDPYLEALRVEGFPSETLYKVPWQPRSAFVTSKSGLPPLQISNSSRYLSESDRQQRDRAVARYVNTAYSNDATPVAVEYPSATTMRVRLRGLPPGRRLVISENWDRSWRAEANGRHLHATRYGPNYIEVDVSQLSGNVVIELHHDMSWDWKLGIALSVLSLLVAAGLALVEARRN